MQIVGNYRPLHRRALVVATGFVARVTPDDLAQPTPCAGWDLQALLGHMIGQNHGFAAAVRNPEPPLTYPATTRASAPVPATAYAARPPHDALAEWSYSAAVLTAAFAAADEGELVLLAEISADQRFPLTLVVGFQLLDTVVHTWDVATALGLPFRPDGELLAATAALARLVPTGPARERTGAAFAPVVEVPDENGAVDEWAATLAILGRSVRTAPAGPARRRVSRAGR